MNSIPRLFRSGSSANAHQFLVEHFPHLEGLARELRTRLEFAVFKTTGYVLEPNAYPAPAPDTLEALILSRLTTIVDRKKDIAVHRFAAKKIALDFKTQSSRYRQRHAAALKNLDSSQSAFDLLTPNEREQQANLPNRAGRLRIFETGGATHPQTRSQFYAEYDRLILRIHKITCVDETDGFWGTEADIDNIALSAIISEFEEVKGMTTNGQAIPYSNIISKPVTFIKDFGHDGDVFIPNPAPWAYHIFDIWNPTGTAGLPKYRSCQFLLTELDNGGFPQFIEDALKSLLKFGTGLAAKEVSAGVTDRLGSIGIGGAAGFIAGGLVGAAVGALASFLVEALVDLIVEIWEDDIFPPQTAAIIIPSFTGFLSRNGEYSDMLFCNFYGHGGEYRLSYSWQLLRNESPNYPPLPPDDYVAPDPDSLGAILFTAERFRGMNKFFKRGTYVLERPFILRIDADAADQNITYNNNVESIKMDDDIVVLAYRNADFSDNPLELRENHAILPPEWANTISAIRVTDISYFIR